MRVRDLILGTLIFGTAACGADYAPPETGHVPSMLIQNGSQYALLELRIHGKEGYKDAINVLPEPLAVSGELVFYGLDDTWFTVMREKSEHGQVLAFTSAEPYHMYRNRAYKMVVYDEAFRVTDDTYLRPDRYEGLIIGDPGPECEWTATATHSDCPKMQ